MTARSKARILALAAAFTIGGALPASAVTAVATDPLNVRSCGSTDCRVVDVLQRGEEVDVRFCEGLWCAIEKPGRDGWVSAKYLARGYDDDFDDFDDLDDFDGGGYGGDGFYDDDFYDDGFYIEPRRYPRRIHRDPFFAACLGQPNVRFCVYD